MTTTLPTRQQVDTATPLNFDEKRSERQANITIAVTPAGLHITCEYTGPIASIPAAVERLRAAGVLDLVKPAPQASQERPQRTKAQRVTPEYDDAGEACCPVHHRELQSGAFGLFCSAKAKPGEVQNAKSYCALRFAE
jgi:hypothetical protein